MNAYLFYQASTEESRLSDLNFTKALLLCFYLLFSSTHRKYFWRKENQASPNHLHLCSFLLPKFLPRCPLCFPYMKSKSTHYSYNLIQRKYLNIYHKSKNIAKGKKKDAQPSFLHSISSSFCSWSTLVSGSWGRFWAVGLLKVRSWKLRKQVPRMFWSLWVYSLLIHLCYKILL